MLSFLYRILDNPRIFSLVQLVLGANRVYAAVKYQVRLFIEKTSYSRVLDVGCGTGVFADTFPGCYVGIDINPEYLRKGHRDGIKKLICGDATMLPVKSDSFPLVFSFGVLHHLDGKGRTAMLNEMWRVCSPDGRLIIIDGIIPSNRLNIIGYILAKLDRGAFKMSSAQFEEMIMTSFSNTHRLNFSYKRLFPYEFVYIEIVKRSQKKGKSIDAGE